MLPPIECRHYGSAGPPVVVLHGGPGAPGAVASLCRRIASWARVLEPLQRRAGTVDLDVDRHVRDLAEVAPAVATVVGHSWGAMLGLSYAAAHPDRLRSLILVGCGTYDESSRAAYVTAMASRLGEAGRAEKARLKKALASTTAKDEREQLFARLAELGQAAQHVDVVPDEEDHALPLDAEGHAQTWDDAMRRQRDGLEPASFSAICCPVTMLHGADDPHPGKQTAETLRRYIPQLDYVALPRCGHEPWRERGAGKAFLETLRRHVLSAW